MGVNNPYGYVYPDVAEMPDLPESATFETGFGYVAVMIAEQKNENVPDENGNESDSREAGEPDDATANEAEDIHDVIDNVLTQQALAWATYARTHRSR